jgi:hypothetical protein
LAFIAPAGVYILHSALVRDLSSVDANLSVSGNSESGVAGQPLAFQFTATNHGPAAAGGMMISLPWTWDHIRASASLT